MTELSLNWIFLDNIWKPDTYVLGGRESFLHRITSPNRLVRLAEDGTNIILTATHAGHHLQNEAEKVSSGLPDVSSGAVQLWLHFRCSRSEGGGN